jgi:hypothetical protein
MFAPWPNISAARQQVARLSQRRRTRFRLKADPIYYAIAVHHSSRRRSDSAFADVVMKGDAPNVDMPMDAGVDSTDNASETVVPGLHVARPAPAARDNGREGGWSSALSPVKAPKPDRASVDVPNCDRSAEEQRSLGPAAASPTTMAPSADSLFVPRSTERRP